MGRHSSRSTRTKGAVVVGVVALALVATSCGARVPAYLGAGTTGGAAAQASASTTTTTAPGTTAGATTPGAATALGSGSGSAATGAGATGAASTKGVTAAATPTSSGFNFAPASEAADCAGSAGNTASDAGVTPSQLTFGNVSGLTGPLTGSFPQGSQGVEALFSALNAAGGICGRKLALDVEDDQQNASVNASDVADLIPKVLAFVGSTSDGDNGGVPAMTAAGVPDVGFAINCNRSEEPVYWSPAGGSCNQPKAGGPYYISNSIFQLAKSGGYFPTHMAFLSYSIAISAQAAEQFEYVYQQMGGSVCYTDFAVSPASASLESDVESMQQKGCNGVLDTMDVTGNAKMLQAMQQQAYTPGYVAATFDAYTPDMIATAGQSAAQGMIVGLPFVPLNESQTMDQLYQQQLATYEPGDQPSGFGFLAWQAAQMLVYALIQSGHNPTRASIVKSFDSLSGWTGGGALGAYTPSTRGVYPCDVDVTIKGTGFIRKAPSSGLFCGGQAVQASS
ncbi:MAG TPA: ABC transporter substrate-binding protein [Acidimicrobiales bacterium]